MSRLIDADVLFKAVTEGRYTTGNIFKDMELQQFINEQPTAYNVDAVVAELEKAKGEIALNEDDLNIYCGALDDAIDIVRKGGVE